MIAESRTKKKPLIRHAGIRGRVLLKTGKGRGRVVCRGRVPSEGS